MAKKTKRSRKTTRKTRRRKKKGTLPPWLSSIFSSKSFLNILFAVMLVGAVVVAVQRIWAYAVGSDAFTVNTGNWDARLLRKTLPDWMTLSTGAINEHISRDDYLRRPHSIFEGDLAQQVARRYERLPWIRKVTRVEKVYPNKLRIDFTWRVPVAKVRYNGEEYLVDEEGVALDPAVYDEAGLGHPLPLIVGMPHDEALPVGEKWRREEVSAAAALAGFLRPLLRELSENEQRGLQVDRITTIDVGGFRDPRRPSLSLKTGYGKVIEWGKPVGDESPNEPCAEKKLANLRKLYEHSADLSAWHDRPLKRRISLHWHEDDIVTSD